MPEKSIIMEYYIILALIVLLGLILYHIQTHYSYRGKLINRIPGPPPLPILGNLLSINRSQAQLFKVMTNWTEHYYPIFKVWLGHQPVTVLRHPDDLEVILTNSNLIQKEFGYEHFRPWLNSGLLISKGEKWHHRRKILTPAFHFNILRKYIEATCEQTSRAIKETRAFGKESKQNLLIFCPTHTLNIICESAMGVSLDIENDHVAKKYKDAIYKMGNIMLYRLMRPYVRDWMLPFMPQLKKENDEVLKNLNAFINKIIKDRRQFHINTGFKSLNELNNENGDDDNIYISEKKRRLAMLDLLLAAERDGLIDEEGIKEEVATFMFEGHDTTAMALTFLIMLLAENKEIQKLAREEVEKIMNKTKGMLRLSDLQEMNYVERCIKESLRLYPSVPMIGRYVTQDVTLKNYVIPKNSDVMMYLIYTHRDPNFWPEPTKFDPNRFLPDQVRQRHPFAYLAFSAGSRNCIGQKFAMMEMKCLIASILYNFELEPIDYTSDVALITDVIIRPEKPPYTKFITIDRTQ